MARYITAQRKQLIAFLRDNPDTQFSAKQIVQQLRGEHISLSAVYRNLAALEKAGLISRSVKDSSREIFYQFIDTDACKNCIHLTCTKCGGIFHMRNDVTDQMMDTVSKANGFRINKTKTVLYGLCKNCT